ncbi:MAG TPA: SWIM zinc finger family protein [Chloroflexota bacterium]|nr:SWIM zinc finger family protein [Chloroflexota bacterium]
MSYPSAPTTSVPQAPAPAISLQTLREVLAKGQAAHPELPCRMERAADIVAFRSISPALAPANVGHAYWVQASDGSREYWVCLSERGYRGDRCTCPDYQQRGGPCKHAIAVRLLRACERAEQRQASPPANLVPWPTPTLDPDAPIPFVLTDKALAYLDGQGPAA